ncbi:hypothetical protein FB465_3807 [Kitasatospora atroaurantiaca]|uniref:Transmembrane protein n=2 Tax=Kitasatospora atroaurantiaca TaxID=285545 RepID=A0A561ESY3_9ACTN|nr:hypothetical protein FB465_3807 [Kitasatospora atroaurantiaca]
MDQSTSVTELNGVPMTNTPHLLAEDRPEFERILDEALRDGSIVESLRAPGPHLNSEQLRTKTLLAADTVAAAAASEYEHYTGLRANLRQSDDSSVSAGGLSTRLHSEDGAGFFPVLTVLTPILAWAAAAVLLLIGYSLRATDPELALGKAVVTAGWISIAVGIAALSVGIIGLLLTALRDGSAMPYGQDRQLSDDVAEARLAWHTALRDRAILPYLHGNLDSEPALSPQPATRPTPPDLLSPGYSTASYSSPGFTSPGVEGLTDQEGRQPRAAEFSSPGYSPPGFTNPDEG